VTVLPQQILHLLLIMPINLLRIFSQIVERVNRGEGSLGLLTTNDTLYLELEKSARDLNLLLEDIKANPGKYVKFSLF
jgi:phospholipid/cholesterol/gamma-HCH transport system substrate-binding protein